MSKTFKFRTQQNNKNSFTKYVEYKYEIKSTIQNNTTIQKKNIMLSFRILKIQDNIKVF